MELNEKPRRADPDAARNWAKSLHEAFQDCDSHVTLVGTMGSKGFPRTVSLNGRDEGEEFMYDTHTYGVKAYNADLRE